jgi:hypothetical protein
MLLTNLKTINYENLYKKLKETTPFLFVSTKIVLFLSYSQQKKNFNIFLLKI